MLQGWMTLDTRSNSIEISEEKDLETIEEATGRI